MLSLLNYPSQRDLIAAVGKAMINCLRPEDRENVKAEIAQALLVGNNYTTAYRMLCRGKGYIWVKETGVQTVLPNGASVLVSLCLDITGQMEAQAELESIVQCPMGGIFRARMDRDWDNPKFCVIAKSGANRVKFIMGGRRVIDCRLVYNITPVGRDVKTKPFISPLPSI